LQEHKANSFDTIAIPSDDDGDNIHN